MKIAVALISAALLAGCTSTTTTTTTTARANDTSENVIPIAISAPLDASGPVDVTATLNRLRAENGRGPLAEDPRLSTVARDYAALMARTGHFSHTGPSGSTFGQRARAAGYPCPRAENIAFGPMSDAQVIANWMTSSGHRRNILLRDARDFGFGSVDDKFVLILGRGC